MIQLAAFRSAQPSKARSYARRALCLGAGLLLASALIGFVELPLFRGMGSFLIVEDPLEPAAAIIALGGHVPFREMEAAKLYREGWAPQVIVVRAAANAEAEALQALKIKKEDDWELSTRVLMQQGVPKSAIVVPAQARDRHARGVAGGLHGSASQGCPRHSRDFEISHAANSSHVELCQRRQITAHRSRGKRRPFRSGTLVAKAQLRFSCRAGISGAGQLLCRVSGRHGTMRAKSAPILRSAEFGLRIADFLTSDF